ncbi:MAG: MBOAT family O-acyltransferase [Chloroflexota bacterium]|nr:MBOAT family O-acyltransferase [Chloroflexota bacterium]
MTIAQILVFSIFALLLGTLTPPRWRGWLLLGGSVLAIYWLQASTPVRNLDFWFPTTSIALTVFVWAVTRKGESEHKDRLTLITGFIIIGLILILGLTRYIEPICCLTPTRPPAITSLLIYVGVAAAAILVFVRLIPDRRILSYAAVILIIAIFVVLKSNNLTLTTSAWLRLRTGQPADLALINDLPWLGFSYLAFRLLHVLRDYQSGKLPAYSLSEFVTYAIFFPTITAGPIDRSQRFVGDLRKTTAEIEPVSRLGKIKMYAQSDQLLDGGWRITWGLFKKFVLADGLALLAINSRNAGQVEHTLWLWVLLYAFALRLYFDFSGYTDIALGVGRLMGFRLPENFNRPYLKTSLTAFWNSWHITLAQWFRAYYFNPLTRFLRRRNVRSMLIIFIGQVSTMLLIGLWHGITWNFALWGLWHGIGLFINNRWSSWVGPRLADRGFSTRSETLLKFGGWFLTFNYVTVGWVWFALPDVTFSLDVIRKLFGF